PEPEPEVLPLPLEAPPTAARTVEVPAQPKPKPVKPPERVVRHDPPRPRVEERPVATAAAPVPAPPAPVAAAAPPSAVPNWQNAVLRRLEQFKRYPSAARFQRQQGVASLRFTIDRNGNVLSAQIARGSGSDLLDQEALALVRRAEPLPAPPPNVPGNTLS